MRSFQSFWAALQLIRRPMRGRSLTWHGQMHGRRYHFACAFQRRVYNSSCIYVSCPHSMNATSCCGRGRLPHWVQDIALDLRDFIVACCRRRGQHACWQLRSMRQPTRSSRPSAAASTACVPTLATQSMCCWAPASLFSGRMMMLSTRFASHPQQCTPSAPGLLTHCKAHSMSRL